MDGGTRMLQRRGSAAEWAASNPILGDGELGYVKDTDHFKVGDGITAWNDLDTFKYIHVDLFAANGDLLVGSGAGAVVRLPRGTVGQRLTVQVDGTLAWEDESRITVIDAVGDLIVGGADDTAVRLAHGATGTHLEVQADGTLAWVAMPAFELAAHAAATYETLVHVAATYETQAHAAATYETQADAAVAHTAITTAASARARKWTRNFMMMGA